MLFVSVLLAAAGVHGATRLSPREADRAQIEFIVQFARASELLVSEEGRHRVRSTARALATERIVAKPRGYEDSPGFKAAYDEALPVLEKGMKTVEVALAAYEERAGKSAAREPGQVRVLRALTHRILNQPEGCTFTEFVSSSQNGLAGNAKEFAVFYHNRLKGKTAFKNVTKDDIAASQLAFSFVLYQQNSRFWLAMQAKSLTWPDCPPVP
jgi:hypothetical protein